MSFDHISLAEAKARLSALVDRAERGERITICRHGRPVAILSPVRQDYSAVLERVRSLRARVRHPILNEGESWRSLAHEGHGY